MAGIAIVVGSAFIVLALIYRFTFGLRKRPGQTRQTQLVMLSLLGAGLLLIGATGLLDIALSKRVTTVGSITRLYRTTGKNASLSFTLVQNGGNSLWLTTSYTGSP
jgi:hypothetical protein